MFGVRTFLGIITFTSVEKPELKNANHFVLVGVGKGGGGDVSNGERGNWGSELWKLFIREFVSLARNLAK